MGIYLKGVDFYPAVISREADKYVARFVDIPNCLAFGANAIEAEIEAGHALAAHFRFLETNGCALPSPSMMRDPYQDGNCVVHILSPVKRSASIPLATAA